VLQNVGSVRGIGSWLDHWALRRQRLVRSILCRIH
jgi:hypothetical protein